MLYNINYNIFILKILKNLSYEFILTKYYIIFVDKNKIISKFLDF